MKNKILHLIKLFIFSSIFSAFIFILISIEVVAFLERNEPLSDGHILTFFMWIFQLFTSSIVIGLLNVIYYELLNRDNLYKKSILKSTIIIFSLGFILLLVEFMPSGANISQNSIKDFDQISMQIIAIIFIPTIGGFLGTIGFTLFRLLYTVKRRLTSNEEALRIINEE